MHPDSTPEPIADPNVAPTPPMGWNSWDCFGVSVTEAEVKANADFMARHLRLCGWQYIVVDLGWYAPDATKDNYKQPRIPMLIDGVGRLVPCPKKFPSAAGGQGLKPLADYVHALGLKFGLHLMRGIPWIAAEQNTPILGCAARAGDISVPEDICHWYKSMYGINMTHPGGQAYYDSLVQLYASWGVDYLKADDMNSWNGEGQKEPYHTDEIEGLARAIRRAGRPMVLSLSPGSALVGNALHLRRHANLFRISADFWDDWPALQRQFDPCARWAPYAVPGHWPDPDMLPIGRIGIRGEVGQPRATNFTPDEQTTLLTLWCIARAPLMFGGHLPESDELSLRQITNREALAPNQHGRNHRQVFRDDSTVAWASDDLEHGGRFAALFNLADQPRRLSFEFTWANLAGPCAVRDLWQREDRGSHPQRYEVELPAHGAGLYRFVPADPAAA